MPNAVIGALRVTLALNSAQFDRGISSAQSSMQRFGRRMASLGKNPAASLTLPFAGIGGTVLHAAGDFQQGMNKVAAISGASGDQMKALSAQARELGRTTKFSASQAADAMGFLAQAGFKVQDIVKAILERYTARTGAISIAAIDKLARLERGKK